MKKIFEVDAGRVDIEQIELKGFASSIAEIEWLLLLLVIMYYVSPNAVVLYKDSFVMSMVAFTAFVLTFHYVNAQGQQRRWKLALETWVMILFITWVVWNTGGVNSPLSNLYLLAIIISAITLGKIVTILEIILIGSVYFFISQIDDIEFTYQEFSQLMIYFAPFVLVAYITTLLVADLYAGRSMFKALAETDDMTNLLNKRSFMALFTKTAEQADLAREAMSVMMIDADNLKHVNDKYGHQAGDLLITNVANTIVECMRSSDIICRYGGDEFVVMLPRLGAARAKELGDRLCKAVANKSFDSDGQKISTTVSVGLASWPDNVKDVMDLLARADESLYESKRLGRNRVSVYSPQMSGPAG
jgi:diguanylate cyclase (GGDEF)-like protein